MSPIPENKATQRDVAQLAGVSHMTVSRVVQGIKTVSPATAERVHEAIKKLKYVPDPALSALAMYRTHGGEKGHGSVLAFLDCDNSDHSHDILDGVRREATWLGYQVESFQMDPEPSHQRQLSHQLYHRGIRGLLFGPTNSEWKFEGWNWNDFAAISLSSVRNQPAMHAVSIDYVQGASTAVSTLLKWGCKRIAMVIHPQWEERTGHRWLGGYCSALDWRKQSPLVGNEFWETPELKPWLRDQRVDGLITLHSGVEKHPSEAWRIAHSLKIKTILLSDYAHVPEVPAMSFDRQAIGTEAVRMMHHLLLSHEFGIPEKTKLVAIQGKLRLDD